MPDRPQPPEGFDSWLDYAVQQFLARAPSPNSYADKAVQERESNARAAIIAELAELSAVVTKLLEYDHHHLQAGFDWEDNDMDGFGEEEALSRDALNKAAQLARTAKAGKEGTK